jgi:hypothetical protein
LISSSDSKLNILGFKSVNCMVQCLISYLYSRNLVFRICTNCWTNDTGETEIIMLMSTPHLIILYFSSPSS